MGRKVKVEPELVIAEDPTGWMLASSFSEFLLMHTVEIKYMCMLGYTFLAGTKVFDTASPTAATSYKFINMILACTGGGIMVPIFINAIPVPLANDAYPIAIFVSFVIHQYFPVVRDVMKLSPVFKSAVIVLYESFRAYVVVILTTAAAKAIPPSTFSFPVFGPIFCGAIAGCGGAFLPLNKGLDPIKNGLAPNMLSALIASTGYHMFLNSHLSDDIIDAPKKAHLHVAVFFIMVGLASAFNVNAKKALSVGKKEN